MKTLNPTYSAPGQRTAAIASWLSRPNELLSALLDAPMTNAHAIGAALSTLLLTVAVLLMAAPARLYGWAALALMLAVEATASMVWTLYREGGER